MFSDANNFFKKKYKLTLHGSQTENFPVTGECRDSRIVPPEP